MGGYNWKRNTTIKAETVKKTGLARVGECYKRILTNGLKQVYNPELWATKTRYCY